MNERCCAGYWVIDYMNTITVAGGYHEFVPFHGVELEFSSIDQHTQCNKRWWHSCDDGSKGTCSPKRCRLNTERMGAVIGFVVCWYWSQVVPMLLILKSLLSKSQAVLDSSLCNNHAEACNQPPSMIHGHLCRVIQGCMFLWCGSWGILLTPWGVCMLALAILSQKEQDINVFVIDLLVLEYHKLWLCWCNWSGFYE